MYDILAYGHMIADQIRLDAYVEALKQAIKPNSIVLEIGTGAGFFAFLACRLGARHVYAIEPNEAIHLAQRMAVANGYEKRITFMQTLSTNVTLPERADLMISDLRGVLPLLQQHIPSIIDARKRLLAPGGKIIPQQDTLWAAVVTNPDQYKQYTAPWDKNNYDFDMQIARQSGLNLWQRLQPRIKPEQLLTEARSWATLHYPTINKANVRGDITWQVAQEGIAHGLTVWFDATLADGIVFSNAPTEPKLVYGSAFFPWLKPVMLSIGDTIHVALQANLIGKAYIWSWNTHILTSNGAVKAKFKQSTFFAKPLSRPHLRRQASDYVPTLDEEGKINHFILTLMDGNHSLSAIARQLATRFPNHFTNWQDALTRVGDLSQQYSQ